MSRILGSLWGQNYPHHVDLQDLQFFFNCLTSKMACPLALYTQVLPKYPSSYSRVQGAGLCMASGLSSQKGSAD